MWKNRIGDVWDVAFLSLKELLVLAYSQDIREE
jgi:hypothetical protein